MRPSTRTTTEVGVIEGETPSPRVNDILYAAKFPAIRARVAKGLP